MAFDARDALGVNVHTAGPAYSGQIPQLKNFLTYLGVKWVRDDNPNGPALLPGLNSQFVVTTTNQSAAVTAANTAVSGGAKAVELLNEPPTVDIMYGTSRGGLSGSLSLSAEDARYGKLNVYRQFTSGMPGALDTSNDVSRVAFYSFKCNGTDYTGMAAGTYDAAIRTWAGTLLADQLVFGTYYHEPENNFPNVGTGSPSFQAAQTHFINLIKDIVAKGQTKARLKSCTIFTAYILSYGKGSIPGGNSTRDINGWWPSVNPDMVGFDFDGVTVTSSYFDWDAIGYQGWAQTFAASKGIPWAVTEFATNPTTGDTSHAGRTAHLQAQAASFAAHGCSYVMYWDDSSSNLTTSNELTAWKTLCQQSAAMVQAQSTNRAVVAAVNGRVPVIASALTQSADSQAAILWGQMRGITQGNLHLYRGNLASTPWTAARTAGYALLPYTANGLTYQVSETGYHDYTGAVNHGMAPTLDSDAATEIVPDFQQLIADGATQVFYYEALDEDLAGLAADSEGYFGLAQDDWTPKPQAVALQAYLATFVTGPTAPLAPSGVIAMAGDSIVDVTWTIPVTGTAPDSYTVTVSPADAAPQTVIAPTQVAVFAGLHNGTAYTFTVVSNNAQGSSAGTVSNTVTPAAPIIITPGGGGTPATGGGSTGSIAPIVKTPFPGPYPPPRLADVTAQQAGQVQQCFFYDPLTADLLQLSPNQSGIWINDLDLGYPTVREVTAPNPGRNGEYDQTQFLGARSITLSLTVVDGKDIAGTVQPASYWVEVLRAWVADPSNRFRVGYQLLGQQQRFANVRASNATGPFIGSGTGRESVPVQLTLRSPDGLLYEQNPLPNDLAVLQNGVLIGDGRFETIIPQAVAGAGLTPPLTPPLTFPVSSTGTIAVPYRGTARSAPEIRIIGACTDPAISALNPDGTIRGKLAFTGITLAGTDELRVDLAAKTAIRIASGVVSSNVRQYLTTWSWFDLLPGSSDPAKSYNRLKFEVGSGTATAKVYFFNCYA